MKKMGSQSFKEIRHPNAAAFGCLISLNDYINFYQFGFILALNGFILDDLEKPMPC